MVDHAALVTCVSVLHFVLKYRTAKTIKYRYSYTGREYLASRVSYEPGTWGLGFYKNIKSNTYTGLRGEMRFIVVLHLQVIYVFYQVFVTWFPTNSYIKSIYINPATLFIDVNSLVICLVYASAIFFTSWQAETALFYWPAHVMTCTITSLSWKQSAANAYYMRILAYSFIVSVAYADHYAILCCSYYNCLVHLFWQPLSPCIVFL